MDKTFNFVLMLHCFFTITFFTSAQNVGGGDNIVAIINLHREDGSQYTNISQLLIVVNILGFLKSSSP